MFRIRPNYLRRIILVALIVLRAASCLCAADNLSATDYFEKNVRPVLVDNCYSCHSQKAEKVKGGLNLETREGLLKGGDSGPAITPGDPEKSLLIRAVRYTDENLQMPPKNRKLSAEQIAALEHWIKIGAPDPRETAAPARASKNRPAPHWAFQPVRHYAPPTVRQAGNVQNFIDSFVLAKLEEHGLTFSRRADKRTLIRRVTFDLTGLPPSAEDVRAFLADETPEAFARVVDRLLSSPQYGERWARHWLDVARYSDTKGYVFEEERRYPYAYTYRDYVIRAFNEDLPFDQFVVEQIAADLLPLGADKRPLAALGYLTLGRRFLNNQPDIIDDRIDVVTRGMMGLTVACARCHDHKFDPVSAKDYYSLYGIFASSAEPEEKPLLTGEALPPQHSAYLAEHYKRMAELNEFRTQKEGEIRSQLRRSVGAYLLAAYDSANLAEKSKAEGLVRERKLDPGTVQRWVKKLEAWNGRPEDRIFGLWRVASQLSDDELPERWDDILREFFLSANGPCSLNPLVAEAFSDSVALSRQDLAERYGSLFTAVDEVWNERTSRPHSASESAANDQDKQHGPATASGGERPNAPSSFDDPNLEELRIVLYGPESPARVPDNEITRLFDVPSIQKLRALKRKMEELDATHPGAPARAMALQDSPVPYKPHVFVRGNPNNPGVEVPRQFVAILAGPEQKPFEKGSGRLELARAIASRGNPLTARVLVNRVWLHYFGAGLVRTPSDFGLRSDPPTHPELLDALAAHFMDGGWSMKKLHRSIVLSRTYQQCSDENLEGQRIDPSNQWLWKMNRRRLDFEAMRDSLLAVSGRLDMAAGGHSVELTTEPFTPRRTIYGFVERQNLPGLFRTFDFASPDTSNPQRFTTTVPQQGLYLLNSPFAIQQARGLAERLGACSDSGDEKRVRDLYELAYQREPSPQELQLGVDFVHSVDKVEPYQPEPVVWQYGSGQLDPETRQVMGFQAFEHFSDDSWHPGEKLPDAKLGWIVLKAASGHPGNDHKHAVVRRWVAPRDVIVAVAGSVRHESDKGDGIEAWIVTSQGDELAHAVVQKGKEEFAVARVELKKGDTLDFVADCRGSSDFDSFTWAPKITVFSPENDSQAGLATEWDSRQDFSGPRAPDVPLKTWERYAQVLLMSNEFVFVD